MGLADMIIEVCAADSRVGLAEETIGDVARMQARPLPCS